jgi:hypothetical protein
MIFPGPLLLGLPFVPESPYWFVMKDKQVEAVAAVRRISGGAEDNGARLGQVQEAVDEERRLSAEKASFIECLKGVNWRRTPKY